MKTIIAGFLSALALLSIVINLMLVAALAAPFQWLWNNSIAGWLGVPVMSYFNASGILAIIFILQMVASGFKLSTRLSV
jgi:hypothetical protein